MYTDIFLRGCFDIFFSFSFYFPLYSPTFSYSCATADSCWINHGVHLFILYPFLSCVNKVRAIKVITGSRLWFFQNSRKWTKYRCLGVNVYLKMNSIWNFFFFFWHFLRIFMHNVHCALHTSFETHHCLL